MGEEENEVWQWKQRTERREGSEDLICWLWGGRNELGVKECSWPLETRKDKETQLLLETSEGALVHWHLEFGIFELLLLSRFSRVRLCVTPETAAHQAPPSLGFSRQEHWSGLPFPSPMHKSEKWKWSRSVLSDSSRPHGLQPTRLLHPWDFPSKSTGVGCHCLLLLSCRNLKYRV